MSTAPTFWTIVVAFYRVSAPPPQKKIICRLSTVSVGLLRVSFITFLSNPLLINFAWSHVSVDELSMHVIVLPGSIDSSKLSLDLMIWHDQFWISQLLGLWELLSLWDHVYMPLQTPTLQIHLRCAGPCRTLFLRNGESLAFLFIIIARGLLTCLMAK